MDITEVSILHHAGIVLVVLWLLSFFNRCHPIAYFFSFIYMYLVHERYVMRLRRKLQYEERKQANRRRALTDSETVRWLNHAVEKMWPICMEQIASQKILLPIIPWFLEKYKPWTAKKAVVQHLYLGRNPPVFTEMRVLQSTGDDHLVLELGMNFLTADDMSTILAVQLRKRLGFGIWAKLHLTGMHVEGKVLVGVKFLREWPFLGRLRICFSEPPYFQMTVKPIFTHGLDVTELPGIAGWLDKLLSIAFEQTLVEPNMLVVDLEKFISPQADDSWFSVDEKEPVAYAKVEVIEASDMKPSDLNGLADPYVKGQVGPYRFKTKIQKKTLAPKWHEEFKIPICTWESTNVLAIEVCDKDHFVDDTLGDCSVNISDLRDGQRHDMWLSLQNIKMGRLHLAITVIEDRANTILENAGKGGIARPYDKEKLNKEDANNSFSSDTAHRASFSSISSDKAPRVPDNFEPINVEGQNETGIWVHQPGSEVAQTWEPRKGKSRRGDTHVRRLPNDPLSGSNASASGSINNDSSSGDENGESKNLVRSLQRGFRKMSTVFHRSPRNEDCSGSLVEPVDSPHANLKAVSEKEIGVKFIVDETLLGPAFGKTLKEGSTSADGSGPESPSKGHVKDMAKSILKHAGKGARSIRHVLSRKGSTKIGSDTSIVTVEDIYAESDSSDDECLSSPRVESITVVSNTISCCCENNGSCDHKEHTVQRDAGEPATKEDDIHLENLESQDREKLSDSVSNGNGLVESSSLKLPEENLEVEKG